MLIFVVLLMQIMKFLQGTKLYSIFTGTCPVCHQGKLYKEPNPYKVSKTLEMHERCSNCDLKYNIEPSFFYGAMYVSYAVGVAIAVATFIITYFFFGFERFGAFISIIFVLFVMLPIILRISRNIWINFFFKYKEIDSPSEDKFI